MRKVAEIEADIAKVKAEMENVRGTTTEVYARIVGYYRSVRNWNPGKREEYAQRKLFVADREGVVAHLPAEAACSCDPAAESVSSSMGGIAHYELFVRKTCPNCPPVKESCARLEYSGELVDVDSAEGFARASAYGVFSAPTVIFFNAEGTEVSRAHSVKEIACILEGINSETAVYSAVV